MAKHMTILQERTVWDAMVKQLNEGKPTALNEAEARAVLNDLPKIFPTGRLSTPKSLQELSELLPYVGGRYGLDTRLMVDASLSAYMATVTRTPNLQERRESAWNSWRELQSAGMNERDNLVFGITLLNHAGAGRIQWEAETLPNGVIRVRSKLVR